MLKKFNIRLCYNESRSHSRLSGFICTVNTYVCSLYCILTEWYENQKKKCKNQ